MPSNNQLSELFGVDWRDRNARSVGLGVSQLNPGWQRLQAARYDNTFFTHFNSGATIPPGVTLTSEGTTTAAATYGIGLGGEATITSDDVAAKTEQLSFTGLCWQANRQPVGQPLYAAVRWKSGATITASEYYVGITDAVADTDPIALSTSSTFTTSAPTNGVYMGYSATPTSGAAFTSGGNQHTAISIVGDANTVVATGGGAFAAATYYTYEFEVDYDGTARWYVNGQRLASMAAALNPAVPLTLSIWAAPRTTVSAAVTVDYMGMAGV